jgi:hypothetical protein
MKPRSYLLLLTIAVVAWAGPASLRAVDVRPVGVIEQLAYSGVRSYGRTSHYILTEDVAAAGVNSPRITLDPGIPPYLVFVPCREYVERVRGALTVLLDDDGVFLTQLTAAQAGRVRLLGGELFRLPDKPLPVYLPGPVEFPRTAFVDTFIQRLIARVNPDSIHDRIQSLQSLVTRYSPTDSCRAAEQHVADYFTWLGMDSVALDSYVVEGDTWRNVVGVRRGRVSPEKLIIICGHMDDYSETPDSFAPGAEDNASGTVMALEAARVLAHESFDMTVMFIAFTGEEEGIWGSYYFAGKMRAMNADIVAALNFDMIAWPGGSFGVAIHGDTASRNLGLYEARMASLYTPLAHSVDNEQYGSDQLAFEYYGYKSTAGAEYGDFYPYYHTTADTIGNCSMPLAAEVCKMAVATAASLALAPAAPEDFTLQDAGVGNTLAASWHPGSSPDVAGYKVAWGTEPQTYTDSAMLGLITSYSITNLQNGTRYYATVMAVDSAGHEGYPAPEQSAVPGLVPFPPANVVALPTYYGMAFTWLTNRERDLAGYNLYRSTVSGSGYERVNSALIADTTFRDSGLQSDTMYYYVVTAVDTTGNESGHSAEVRGKPVTLDHGILLVDETRDGSGRPGSPSDEQQDAFYHLLLHGARFTDRDVASQGIPMAGDVGPYSTIVWHADDYTQMLVKEAVPGLANYLTQGGRMWYVGWQPVRGLMGSSTHYPYTFLPGEFPYDYLHLSGASQDQSPEFIGAAGQAGYPGISTDSAKMVAAAHGRLSFGDVLYPRDADIVLTFNWLFGDLSG